MSSPSKLHDVIESTIWVDTHEHLVEERHRLSDTGYRFRLPFGEWEITIPADWTALLVDYSFNDLISAGLSFDSAGRLFGDDLAPGEKWKLVSPYYDLARNTGYLHAVDLTTETLFGLRLSADTCEEIDQRLRTMRQPGYFSTLIRETARIERCQVHSFDHDPFCESEYPDLLEQDLSIVPLARGRHDRVEDLSGIEVSSLSDYVAVIEWCFNRFANQAVAAKCAWAYMRPLEVRAVDEPPSEAFQRLREGVETDDERREVEDYLFDICVRLATENGLPVKIHLGYLDGISSPELLFLRNHVEAATRLAQAYPETMFVLMHMAWPHQEELLAVVKHHPNVVLDLCWSWILAPTATRDFVTRFLTCVPSNKLFCFGGDYMVAENIVGHASIARSGLEAALTDLVEANWFSISEACELATRLMRSNAEQILPSRARI